MSAKGCTHRDTKVSIHVGSPLQSGSSLQTARWLWQARQRAVRKFSADKLARIVRIILQGLPVLTAAGGLSWHNLFLSIPRPSSPSPFFFLFPPLSLSLLFPLLFPFFFLTSFSSSRYVSIGFGSRERWNLSRPDPRGTGKERLEECGTRWLE